MVTRSSRPTRSAGTWASAPSPWTAGSRILNAAMPPPATTRSATSRAATKSATTPPPLPPVLPGGCDAAMPMVNDTGVSRAARSIDPIFATWSSGTASCVAYAGPPATCDRETAMPKASGGKGKPFSASNRRSPRVSSSESSGSTDWSESTQLAGSATTHRRSRISAASSIALSSAPRTAGSALAGSALKVPAAVCAIPAASPSRRTTTASTRVPSKARPSTACGRCFWNQSFIGSPSPKFAIVNVPACRAPNQGRRGPAGR